MDTLRIGLPSKGELEPPTLEFLKQCGLAVHRNSQRQYTARLGGLDDVLIIFQRTADIFSRVDENSVDLGITGLDIVREMQTEEARTLMIYDNLGYGMCELVLAVPDSWLDVSTLGDLAEVATEFRQKGRDMRIATKYPNLTQQFMYQRGIRHLAFIESEGALEAAVELEYADIIADITTSGTTLRENHLKRIAGGTILLSQACLIGNRSALSNSQQKLEKTRLILELIEAHRRSSRYRLITAKLCAPSQQALTDKLSTLSRNMDLRDIKVVALAPDTGTELQAFSVDIVTEEKNVISVIEHLRAINHTEVMVSTPQYLFEAESQAYKSLASRLKSRRKAE